MTTVFEPTPHTQKLVANLEEVTKRSWREDGAIYRMTQVSCLKVGDEISYWLEDLDNTELNGLIVTGIEPLPKTRPDGLPTQWAYMSDAMSIQLVDTNAWREQYGNYSDEKIVGTGVYDQTVHISADIIVAVKVV
tara:strand:- start:50 stop:454 length:405 start_codon:yes stop_codon:yes gene_type:complete